MKVSLRYADNGTGHNDLVLSLGGRSFRCDSYYLAIDDTLTLAVDGPGKVPAVLRLLLGHWLAAVGRLADGDTVYLPYDYSDQYVGWLACTRTGDDVAVARGWSEDGGWDLTPSAPGDLAERPRAFRLTGPFVFGPVIDLAAAIRASVPGDPGA